MRKKDVSVSIKPTDEVLQSIDSTIPTVTNGEKEDIINEFESAKIRSSSTTEPSAVQDEL